MLLSATKTALCNDLKREYLRWALVCWGLAHCYARTGMKGVIKSTSVREKLLLAQVLNVPSSAITACSFFIQLILKLSLPLTSS